MTTNKDPIACIGAGVIGRSWAVLFAKSGRPVKVYDADPQTKQHMRAYIGSVLEHEAGSDKDTLSARLSAITITDTLEEAVSGTSYVQESVSENKDLKRRVLSQIDKAVPESAIIGSSTSGIPGHDFLGHLAGRSRCIVVHPINPPHLIPLVEICPTEWTSRETIDRLDELMTAVGQQTIVVNKDIPGFIFTRLSLALIGEAFHLVGEGICAPQDIDKVFTHGLGLRWALLGLFAGGHLNADGGYGDYVRKYREPMQRIIQDLHVGYPWSDQVIDRIDSSIKEILPEKDIAQTQNRRDQALSRLTVFLTNQRKAISHSSEIAPPAPPVP